MFNKTLKPTYQLFEAVIKVSPNFLLTKILLGKAKGWCYQGEGNQFYSCFQWVKLRISLHQPLYSQPHDPVPQGYTTCSLGFEVPKKSFLRRIHCYHLKRLLSLVLLCMYLFIYKGPSVWMSHSTGKEGLKEELCSQTSTGPHLGQFPSAKGILEKLQLKVERERQRRDCIHVGGSSSRHKGQPRRRSIVLRKQETLGE